MATSNNFPTDNSYIVYYIEMIQNSQSVPNNRSNVTVRVWVRRTNTGHTTYGSGTVYCNINGVRYTSGLTSSDKITNSPLKVFERTLNISHSGDGTKTLAMSASINHSRFSTSTHSFNVALSTIPRATTITSASMVGSIRPGQTQKINIELDRKHSNFTHSINIYDGSKFIGEWLGQGNPTSLTLSTTHIDRLLNAMKSVESKNFTLGVTTRHGSTTVGSRQTRSINIRVSSTVKPSISGFEVKVAGNGHDKSINRYVEGISKAKVTFNSSASGSATVKSNKVEVKHKSFPTIRSYNGNSITSEILANSGSVDVKAIVVDSRGREVTQTKTIQVYGYNKPWIREFEGQRNKNNPTKVDINIKGNWEQFSVPDTNILNMKLQYRELGGSWVNEINENMKTGTTGPGDLQRNPTISNLSDIKSYDIRLILKDSFGYETISDIRIGTGKVALTIKEDIGIGVGKVWERGAVDAVDDVYIKGKKAIYFNQWEDW